jgi:hypothetical protein
MVLSFSFLTIYFADKFLLYIAKLFCYQHTPNLVGGGGDKALSDKGKRQVLLPILRQPLTKIIWDLWSRTMRNRERLVYALIIALLFSFAFVNAVNCAPPAKQEETIAGTVVKTDKGIVIEAEDGDYIVKGQDLSKMVGKMVEVTGIITENDKGDVIEVKSYEEIQE